MYKYIYIYPLLTIGKTTKVYMNKIKICLLRLL